MDELQKRVDDWAQQWETPYWPPHEILARIIEETGELGREINHLFGIKKKKSTEETKELGDEISDLLFALICLANSQNISLSEAFDKMMQKIETRDANRFTKKA